MQQTVLQHLDLDQHAADTVMVLVGMIHLASPHGFYVEALSADQVGAVFPLMRAADPSLSPAIWRQFARRAVSGNVLAPQGVLVARRSALKYPSGAVCYRRHRNLHHAAVLTAEHFVALDLLYPDMVIAALIDGLEPVARRLGCASIRSIVHDGADTLSELLQRQGHSAEGITMTKILATNAPSHAAQR
jgi:hypothetical protein